MLCFEGRHTVLEGEIWPEDSLGDAFLPRDVCLPHPLSSRLLPALSPQTRDSESSTQKGQTGRTSGGVLGKDRPRDQRDISEAFGDTETVGDTQGRGGPAPRRPRGGGEGARRRVGGSTRRGAGGCWGTGRGPNGSAGSHTHRAPGAGCGWGPRRAPRGQLPRAPGRRLGQQLVQQAQGLVRAVWGRRGAGVGLGRPLSRLRLPGLLPRGRRSRRDERPRPALRGCPAGPRRPAVGAAEPPQGPAAPAAAAAHGAPAARRAGRSRRQSAAPGRERGGAGTREGARPGAGVRTRPGLGGR